MTGSSGLRLSGRTLAELGASVELPRYDRSQLQPGIVHIGVGAFFRAHLAWYTDLALSSRALDWGIVGFSLRSDTAQTQLAPQDGLYTVMQIGDGANPPRVIGSLLEVQTATPQADQLLSCLADPRIRIVSLTITEKGYCHDPASGTLNLAHPDIQWDLQHPEQPKSAIGVLAAACANRFAQDLPAFTVLCCDNLPANGRLLKGLVVEFTRQTNPQIAPRIETEVPFPCAMVDRIVPATTEQDVVSLQQQHGYQDAALVKCEPFTQWVIEDHFAGGRPDWGSVGVLLVDDVAAYETMKLRLLNGSHSAIAYLGSLMGYEFVDQAMDDPLLAEFIAQLMRHELAATLDGPGGVDLPAYQQQLRQRFCNRMLQHKTAQIAMDGSQKLPQRILAPLRQLATTDADHSRLSIVLAAWITYVSQVDASGDVLGVEDPLSDWLLVQARLTGHDPRLLVEAIFSQPAIFDTWWANNATLLEEVSQQVSAIRQRGVASVLREVLS